MGINMKNNIVSSEVIHKFAFTNEDACVKPIKAVVLDFHGLGFTGMISEPPPLATLCAEKSILYVFPYYGPWSWMNDTAVRFTDDVIAAIYKKHNLAEDIPVISSGGSMGGLSALIYSRYAEKTPAACAVNCPVCDLPFHYTERDDLPRTLYQAFGHYPDTFEKVLESASPVHQVKSMPSIPYYVVHGDADIAVNKQLHSDIFVANMIGKGHSVTYAEVANMGHCDLKDEHLEQYLSFLFSFA